MMDMVANVTMFAMTMVIDVMLRVKERQCDHQSVKYV
jgi:hypothetical protein